MKWHNETRRIDELIPSDYNPRKISKKEEKQLENSLDDFGLADIIIVNTNNRIIGGHQRYAILKRKGVQEVDVRVPEEELNEEQERELNLRLNRNLGEFEKELLKDFDKEMLEKVGFEDKEIDSIFTEQPEKPEVEFTTEVLESNNYVVFYFDNVMDWEVIKDKFNLTTKQSLDSTEDYKREGVGRVVNGQELIDALNISQYPEEEAKNEEEQNDTKE